MTKRSIDQIISYQDQNNNYVSKKRKTEIYETEIYSKIIDRLIDGTELEMLDIIYDLYKNKFVCTNIFSRESFEFIEHRWAPIGSDRKSILEKMIIGLSEYCTNQISQYSKDTKNTKIFDDHLSKLMLMSEKLNDIKYIKNIVNMCELKFYDPQFLNKLDDNPYLVGFNNGIYDLKIMCFRQGKPDDFVSKSVGYDYEKFDGDEQIFDKIYDFFSQTYTDLEFREYMLTFLAAFLTGIKDSDLHILVDGAKTSIIIQLIKNLLGEYVDEIPVSLLDRKNISDLKRILKDYKKRVLVIRNQNLNNNLCFSSFNDINYIKHQFNIVIENNCDTLNKMLDLDNESLYIKTFMTLNIIHHSCTKSIKYKHKKQKIKNFIQPLAWMLLNIYYPKYQIRNLDKKVKNVVRKNMWIR